MLSHMGVDSELDDFILDCIDNFCDVRDDHEDRSTDRDKMIEIFRKKAMDAKIAAVKASPHEIEEKVLTHFIAAMDQYIRYATMEVRYMELKKKENKTEEWFPVIPDDGDKKAVH